jgi:hypothetical protein
MEMGTLFSDACRLYWSLKCHVGPAQTARGLGCALTPRHVLTAKHVFGDDPRPTVASSLGIWSCRVLREWPDADLAVLEQRELLRPADMSEPKRYPEVSSKMPGLGQSLGYLAELHAPKACTYFAQGHVAFFQKGEADELLFGLAGGLIQRGFSGGPVFTPAGQLVGVIVQSFQFVADLEHRAVVSLPLFSPLARIAGELADLS